MPVMISGDVKPRNPRFLQFRVEPIDPRLRGKTDHIAEKDHVIDPFRLREFQGG